MENEKWRMENGEWKMENGEWKGENGKRKIHLHAVLCTKSEEVAVYRAE